MLRAGIFTTVLTLAAALLADAAVAAGAASVEAQFSGAAQSVYDTRTQACEAIDIPDGIPRAFRDDRNQVHLVATHFVARGMVGPNLDSVKHDCRVLYRSPEDPAPDHFEDLNWLDSFFSVDGRRVAALVHSEYHGNMFPGGCPLPEGTPARSNKCQWDVVTFGMSDDGGFSFTQPPPPRNLVASLPYAYDPAGHPGPAGYQQPTNILKVGAYYYAMFSAWPYRAQHLGACVMRTTDLFDPASWRAWDGQGFNLQFVNPYVERDFVAEQRVCTPVLLAIVQSIAIHSATGTFVATAYTADRRFGPPGLYLSASADLVHWSKPSLVETIDDMKASEQPGDWNYDYFALLDPASTDRNFSTISDRPFVYYVRFDRRHPPLTRDLMRRQVQLRATR